MFNTLLGELKKVVKNSITFLSGVVKLFREVKLLTSLWRNTEES